MEVLTLHSGILEDQLLPLYRFFGREEELFDLKEMILEDRKCLISGIGGIGKTELLRQMIRLCMEEKIVDKLAIVTYEAGIIESFARSFSTFDRKNSEESFHAILYQLRKESEQGKVLLLIDNLTKSVEEDPDLKALSTLPCGILITTRRNVLAGFEIYRLKEPSANTGTLIFRDNYGKRLDHENLAALKEIFPKDFDLTDLEIYSVFMGTALEEKYNTEEFFYNQQYLNALQFYCIESYCTKGCDGDCKLGIQW